MNEKYILKAHKFKQGEQEYLSLILPFKIVNALSQILIYGKTEYGYQRNTIKSHYMQIKDYLLNDSDSNILPTSLILGANKDEIYEILEENGSEIYTLNLDLSNNDKIFRIVDGQHRLKGLEEAAKEDEAFLDYLLHVIIMITDGAHRSIELNVFTNINSKAKRIKVDLAQLAKHNYEILEGKIEDINRHIAIKAAYNLKETIPQSKWHRAIKFDIHSEVNLGVIGVTAFCESIENIVNKFLLEHPLPANISLAKVIDYTDNSAEEIAAFINKAWDLVCDKWPLCFEKDFVVDTEGVLIEIYFSNAYYIQKTLGAKTINVILGDLVKEFGFNETALKNFENLIFKSKLKSNDWKTGFIFAGLSSDSGFRKARKIVRNELEIPTMIKY